MTASWVRRTDQVLEPDPSRVLAALFLPGQEAAGGRSRSSGVIERVLALSQLQVERTLAELSSTFAHRHRDLTGTWDRHADLVAHRLPDAAGLSAARRRLVGAYFTQERTLEGAGLANPSMVAHPDQSGLAVGSTRFVMTVRAIGEGHVSSVELRTGTVDAGGAVLVDPPPEVAVPAAPLPARFSRLAVAHQLAEADGGGGDPETASDAAFVLAALPETFDGTDLARALGDLHAQRLTRGSTGRTADRFARIVAGTYRVEFPADSAVHERVLTPQAPQESHGIEDVRLVRFDWPDGEVEYLATATAYDGATIAGELLRSADLRTFGVTRLSGPGARDKGLALFPRMIGKRFHALSRADRETNAVTTSADLLHWVDPVRVQAPVRPWEIVQLGNCGPPLETEQGWLVLTHGVGPMRRYGIGALLLHLEDPTRVLGVLPEPLLTAQDDERSGYVPNVVYSCGAMLHGRSLVLPYGCSDDRTRIAVVDLDALLEELRPARP